MFLTIVLALLILWVVGFVFFHIAGFLIHILLIVAVIMVITRLIQGKKILS